MKWIVYYHDFNGQKMTTFNIFDHGGFTSDVAKSLKKFKNKEDFAKQLRSDLFYYFGSKCEYEVIIAPWVGGRDTKEIKIDIYNQVMLNWDVFLDYVWNSKKRRTVAHTEDLSDGALD